MVSKHSSKRDVRELRELRGLEANEEEFDLSGKKGKRRGVKEGRGGEGRRRRRVKEGRGGGRREMEEGGKSKGNILTSDRHTDWNQMWCKLANEIQSVY